LALILSATAAVRLAAREKRGARRREAGQRQRRRELQHELTMGEPCASRASPAPREGLNDARRSAGVNEWATAH
jgi:hypothetical protein